MQINEAERVALLALLGLIMPEVNHGCDAWLGNPNDDNCLLSYDDPHVDVLNALLAKLGGNNE